MNLDTDHLLSQEVTRIAENIAYRYQNLKVVFIPEHERVTEAEKNYPYAVVDTMTGNLIRKFSKQSIMEAEKWLWENDSQRVDTYAAFTKQQEKEKADREYAHREKWAEPLEVAGFLIGGKKHYPRHNGVTFNKDYTAEQKGIVGNAD